MTARLAIDGGSPVRSAPLPPWPAFDEGAVEAGARVLRSGRVNYWTGDEVRAFEREWARRLGRKYAIAVANGTVSLELLLRAHGVGPGDEVITTPRTFVASASSIVAVGATPVFADVDRDSGNLDPAAVARAVTPRTRAILPVHLAGWPCDMNALMDVARAHDLVVIEDCAQAHGASIGDREAGALGHSASFSFCQDKILTTAGEGGLVVTDDEDVWRAAWAYKDHGKSYAAVYEREHPPGYRWLVESFGTNLRMTEIQAAVGQWAMTQLDDWLARRADNAERLVAGLAGTPGLRIPRPADGVHHANYKFYAHVAPEQLRAGWDRDRVLSAIIAEGIPCGSGSCSEVYLERAYAVFAPTERLPVAQELGDTSLMFMVHPTLEPADVEDTVRAVDKVMRVAAR
jgi:dTDP-4-amino-4,6-dideoxygalactose transaminase